MALVLCHVIPLLLSYARIDYVVWVGAELAGLVAVLTLVKNGIRVRLAEKNVEHRKGHWGAGITISRALP
jgi:ribulose 1,5-bisphosphate synthetase/thiazole synthase